MLVALGDIYAQIQQREAVRELMRQLQARAREQPGCQYFAFAETLDDPGRFVVVQQWRDRAALDDHFRSQAFARYQAGVAPYLVRNSELRVHDIAASVRPIESSRVDISHDD